MNFSVSYQNHLYQGRYRQQPVQTASIFYQQPAAVQDCHVNEPEPHIRRVGLDNAVTLQQDAVLVGENLYVLAFAAMFGDDDNDDAWDDTHKVN